MTYYDEYREIFGDQKANLLQILPDHMIEGMILYILKGIPPGSFMLAVLAGDLFEALRRADDVNVHALYNYGRFLISSAPIGCYGSEERVSEWIKDGGMQGLTQAHKETSNV